MDIKVTQDIEETGIKAGMVGQVIGRDELGQTWVSFQTSPYQKELYPFTDDELEEFTQ